MTIDNSLTTIGRYFLAVFVAYIGLIVWEKQRLTKTKQQFLDDLHNTINEYIKYIAKSLGIFKVIKLLIEEEQRVAGMTPGQTTYDGLTKYILTPNGVKYAACLQKSLEMVSPIQEKMKLLLIKGKMLNFSEYNTCEIASHDLFVLYEHLSAVADVLSMTNLNFASPETQKTLETTINAVTPNELEEKTIPSYAYLKGYIQNEYQKLFNNYHFLTCWTKITCDILTKIKNLYMKFTKFYN